MKSFEAKVYVIQASWESAQIQQNFAGELGPPNNRETYWSSESMKIIQVSDEVGMVVYLCLLLKSGADPTWRWDQSSVEGCTEVYSRLSKLACAGSALSCADMTYESLVIEVCLGRSYETLLFFPIDSSIYHLFTITATPEKRLKGEAKIDVTCWAVLGWADRNQTTEG